MNPLNQKELLSFDREPKDPAEFENWIQQLEVVPFLEAECRDEDIIVYASFKHAFMHAVLVPTFETNAATIEQLLKWNFSVDSGWGFGGSMTAISIDRPLSHAGELFESGEPIFFLRTFDGVPRREKYYELSPSISQVLQIHHMEERHAWCDLNRQGDIDEIVKIHEFDQNTVITFRRDRLGEYATAADLTLVRMFDFTRYRQNNFNGWHDPEPAKVCLDHSNVFGSLCIRGKTGSYSRGVQIVDVAMPKSELLREFSDRDDDEKQYATFIALDWRHDVVADLSCAPDHLSNYFQPTDCPFEMSPAFFRPEVLSKYKSDPEKYRIEHRSIACRGSWYLKGFGVNDAGQVHAYVGYLGNLPYEEQLHWKQFNEEPKAGLSKSVITTDFDGEFSDEYEPLSSLMYKLHEVEQRQIGWWVLRDRELPRRVHYPLTDTRNDWANELLNLDQFLVEGLDERWLRRKATDLGRKPDVKLRALKLLEECLCGAGFDADHSSKLMKCWHDVHNLRSELKGHASNSAGRERELTARKEHGSLVAHFKALCTACDESLDCIIQAIEQ